MVKKLPVKNKRKPRKNREHYVDNAKFLQSLSLFALERQAYYKEFPDPKDKRGAPPVPEDICKTLLLMAKRLSNCPSFANYPFKEDMIFDGIENCINYIDNFDVNRPNPFAYFTQILYWAYVRRINKEKQYLYTKYKSIEESLQGMDLDNPELQQYGSKYADLNMREYIEQFESKLQQKNKKNKSKKQKSLLE